VIMSPSANIGGTCPPCPIGIDAPDVRHCRGKTGTIEFSGVNCTGVEQLNGEPISFCCLRAYITFVRCLCANLRLQRILPPKIPFFARQEVQILSKILPQIPNFARFSPSENEALSAVYNCYCC